jgi:predicted alpha/beta hydrolase
LAAHWLHADDSAPALATVVIHSATGVPRRFYAAFAQHLCDQGFDVLLWDARGIGESATLPVGRDPATMRDWGQRDQQAVLRHVRARHPSRPLVIVSHSSGGHLAGLAPLTACADALILVASGLCDWRDYPVAQWPRLLGAWWVAAPVLTALWGHLPAWARHPVPCGPRRNGSAALASNIVRLPRLWVPTAASDTSGSSSPRTRRCGRR